MSEKERFALEPHQRRFWGTPCPSAATHVVYVEDSTDARQTVNNADSCVSVRIRSTSLHCVSKYRQQAGRQVTLYALIINYTAVQTLVCVRLALG